jgi:biotin transport system substrate-specific component
MNRTYFLNLTLKDLIIIPIFSVLMIVGARITIPFSIVPITFQPFFCALAAVLIGSKKSFISMILYIFIGLAGLPVFAYGGGLSYIANPTFGFIIGFPVAAFIIGIMTEKRSLTFIRTMTAMLFGLIAMYIIGCFYFSIFKEWYFSSDSLKLLWTSFIPYFIKDLCLYIIIAILTPSIVSKIQRAVR